jgi:hypothetical protein
MSPLTGVLTEAWSLYRRYAAHFLLISFVIYLITAIVVALLGLAGVAGGIIAAVVSFIATYVVQTALIKAVQDVRDGRVDLDLGQTVRAALPYLWPVIGASILAAIGITIGFFLLIVPGFILLTFWCLIVPFIVVGGSRALDSFANSWRTVRGYAWRVFGTYVLVFLILVAFGIVLGLILGALPRFWSNFVNSIVSGTLIAPFLALVATLIYYRLTAAHAGEPYAATSPTGTEVWEPPYPPTPAPTDSPTAPPPTAAGTTKPYPTTPPPTEPGSTAPHPAEPGPTEPHPTEPAPSPPPDSGPERPPPPPATP